MKKIQSERLKAWINLYKVTCQIINDLENSDLTEELKCDLLKTQNETKYAILDLLFTQGIELRDLR